MAEFEKNVLDRHPAAALDDDEKFCAAAGEIQGEFLVLHPFREGNARAVKLATDILAVQSGRPLLIYDSSPAGSDAYIAAAKAAFKKEYQPMADVIRGSLERARKAT
jgi:cell filamentation protein